ncbi:hypothetical protein WN944_014722 [Citrus x changshan-huyou]|uniref:Uncharacterized protein n=1 Tax=Citrus x changshan-huyou TaxID=2935761 RepID=A0AAP0M673_9ROSI
MVLDLDGKGTVAGWVEVDSKGGSDVKERQPTTVKVEEQRPAAVKVEEQGSGGSNLRSGVFD